MKKITVYVSTGFVGSKKAETIEVEDDADDDQIEEIARDCMFSLIEWGWYEGEEKKSRW